MLRYLDMFEQSIPSAHAATVRILETHKGMPRRYRMHDGNPPRVTGHRDYERVFDNTFERDTQPRSGRSGFR